MQQFLVPQFIDVEDKVMGPITVRQFIILLVMGLIMFITYKLADFTLFVLLGAIEFMVGSILAFARINGQPFHFFLLNFLQTARRPGRRVWDKRTLDQELRILMHVSTPPMVIPKPRKEPLSRSRLTEIALVVDTGGMYDAEK